MKKILVILLLILVLFLLSCSEIMYKDVEVYQGSLHKWEVSIHNGYICTNYDICKDDIGTYQVTFTFEKAIKE